MEFLDLNVRSKTGRDSDRETLLRLSFELGWDAICWNIPCVGIKTIPKPIPLVDITPNYIHLCKQSFKSRSLYKGQVISSTISDMKQYSRITLTIDDVNEVQAVNSSNIALQPFNIVAVCPGNQKVFTYCCQQGDIDVISFNFNQRIPYSINKKLLDTAVSRGIYFEVTYSSFLTSSNTRKEMLSSSQVILQYLHGRNVVLTSGADSFSQLRGPHDVSNLANTFGISRENSLKVISNNCVRLIAHAAMRKRRFIPLERISAEELAHRYSGVLIPKVLLTPVEDGLLAIASDAEEASEQGSEADDMPTRINDNATGIEQESDGFISFSTHSQLQMSVSKGEASQPPIPTVRRSAGAVKAHRKALKLIRKK